MLYEKNEEINMSHFATVFIKHGGYVARWEGKVLGRAHRAPPGAGEAKARPEQRSKSRDASAEPAISGTAIGQEVCEGACGFMKAASKPLNRSLPRPDDSFFGEAFFL